MKKLLASVLLMFIIGIFSTTMADAIYLGTFEGNDNDLSLIEIQINSSIYYTGPDVVISEQYAKVDAPADVSDNGKLTITYDPGNQSGTWATADAIDFFSVKASRFYSIFWVEDGATAGTWTTEYITNPGGNQPEISHFTCFVSTPSDPPSDVPEPTLISLLSIGLLTAAGFSRRRKL
ncbi:MAG: PEP-CTERM sorting domain-containing protein [Chitinispirillia bacterium]